MHEKELPNNLWGEVVHTVMYLLNRCPIKGLDNLTPFEVFNGRKSRIKHLKVFGSVCYSLIPNNLRHKLEETSARGIFIGCSTCEKGYRIFIPKTLKMTISTDVIFDENGKWDWKKGLEEVCVLLISNEIIKEDDLGEEIFASEFPTPQSEHC